MMLIIDDDNRLAVAVLKTELITVAPTTKLEDVAKLFQSNAINAAPVVDGVGKCVGIVTGRDLVRFDSTRCTYERQFKHGIAFDIRRDGENDALEIEGLPFDEVAYHMSVDVKTIDQTTTLAEAGRLMCREQIHHLLLLDDAERPIGIISSLDVLKEILDEPLPTTQWLGS